MSTLAIVAGSGPIPTMLAEHCRNIGRKCVIFAVCGAADPGVERFPHQWINLGTVGKTLRAMRRHGCTQVVFIGKVERPAIRQLRLDWKAIRVLPAYLRATRGGDDQLLRFPVDLFEKEGFTVVGADDVLPALAASSGVLGKIKPRPADWADIRLAAASALEIGRRDLGQGAVARDGTILAVEGADGTDAMLRRCARQPGSTPDLRRGVLVKRRKPQQERRIDLPTIGISTVRNAAQAGLAGIAVGAGGALIVDLAEVVAEADCVGLFLVGLGENEFESAGQATGEGAEP